MRQGPRPWWQDCVQVMKVRRAHKWDMSEPHPRMSTREFGVLHSSRKFEKGRRKWCTGCGRRRVGGSRPGVWFTRAGTAIERIQRRLRMGLQWNARVRPWANCTHVECGPVGQASNPACQDISHRNRGANSQGSAEIAGRRIHQAYSTLADENHKAFKDPLHVPVRPITKARSKKHLMGWFKRFGLILTQDIPSLAQRKMKV